jgi:hypothetical protein
LNLFLLVTTLTLMKSKLRFFAILWTKGLSKTLTRSRRLGITSFWPHFTLNVRFSLYLAILTLFLSQLQLTFKALLPPHDNQMTEAFIVNRIHAVFEKMFSHLFNKFLKLKSVNSFWLLFNQWFKYFRQLFIGFQ